MARLDRTAPRNRWEVRCPTPCSSPAKQPTLQVTPARFTAQWQAAAEHLVQHHSETVDVGATVDPVRRAELYAELEALGAQAWLTGADPAAFAEIEARADVLEVRPGRVARADDR